MRIAGVPDPVAVAIELLGIGATLTQRIGQLVEVWTMTLLSSSASSRLVARVQPAAWVSQSGPISSIS